MFINLQCLSIKVSPESKIFTFMALHSKAPANATYLSNVRLEASVNLGLYVITAHTTYLWNTVIVKDNYYEHYYFFYLL